MTPLEMLRDGGPGAFAALFFSVLGAAIGIAAVIALLAKARSAARVLGALALLVTAGAASFGVVGMQAGIRKADRALAGVTDQDALRERVRVEGFVEAQCAAKIGFGGALLPFVLGAIASVVGAALPSKARPASRGKWGLTVAALGIALVPTAGAGLASFASPHARYAFNPLDPAPWDLKYARERIDRDPRAGCDDFDSALDEARQAGVDPQTIVPDAREAATQCARSVLAEIKAAGGEVRRPKTSMREERVWNADTLLASPLAADPGVHREVEAYAHTTLL